MTKHCVYWIHNIQMSDPTTQGYVGVTNNIQRRVANHLSKLKNEHHENIHFQRAYNIDDELTIDVIFEGSEIECYAKEQELRPERGIGWNINVGGTKPPTKVGNQHARGNRGPIKQVVSSDGTLFESRKAAALYYGVDVSTIHNWMKDPHKPWIKGASSTNKLSQKHDISKEGAKRARPIMTPLGRFKSIRDAALAYGVVHGTINYWLKTKTSEFYYLIKSDVSA